MNSNVHLDATVVLLMQHYTLETAKYKAQLLYEVTEKSPLDTLLRAGVMAQQEEPWWDDPDPKVRATQQLQINTLLLRTVDDLVSDVEAALEQELPGETDSEKFDYMSCNVPRILAELKGETYVDPLQALLNNIQGMEVPEETPQYEDPDDGVEPEIL